MSSQFAMNGALLVPLLGALLIALCGRWPNLRETVTLVTAGLLFALVLSLLPEVFAGARPEVTWVTMLPGVTLGLRVEPLGLLFALVASGLWIVTSVYAIGYMRGHNEHSQTRFYACFAVALAAAMGVAFAADLMTLFICYEVLTLSTYPLVAHQGDEKAMRGGRIYLGILLSTSMGLLLPAMVWTWLLADSLQFTPGGLLAGQIEGAALVLLLGLYAYGVGKAAMMPLHRWLPEAMVAPTPVSALLHAVAVVKAGVFTVLKIAIYIFGADTLSGTTAATLLAYGAAIGLVTASLIALGKDNLKARLAYSTVSQLAYIVLAAALANAAGLLGGALHIAMHAAGKITLFFCAGAIYVAHHRTEVSQLDGLGRRMPFTFAAFFIGALSIIGIPPLGGSWTKWYLVLGSIEAQHWPLVAALALSSVLNIAYLLPIVARGFFLPARDDEPRGISEAPLACVLPLCLTALLCVALFFGIDPLAALLRPLTEGTG